MKRKWKRLLSFCLSLLLFGSMIPCVHAAEVAEETTITEDIGLIDAVSEETVSSGEDYGIMPVVNNPVGFPWKNGLVWSSDSSKEFYITFNGVTKKVEMLCTYGIKLDGIYQPCYCIDPGNVYAENEVYTPHDFTVADAWDSLSIAQRRAIGLAMIYGYPNGINYTDYYDRKGAQAATQMIIWEICYGMRSANAPYTCTDTRFIDMYNSDSRGNEFTDGGSGANNGTIYNLKSCYYAIAEKMANHFVIPSFTVTDSAFAKTFEMTPNGNGTFSVTLTDTNNILSQCTFTNTEDLTFTRKGNQLTVTANKAISELTVSASKNVPNINTQTFIIWTYPGKQTLAQPVATTSDPMPLYFKLKVSSGNVALTKTTEDNINKAGWQFGVYSDQACTNLISGPHTTDKNGSLKATGLPAGEIWIKELGNVDETVNALYECKGPNPQKVTIIGGQTATVSFSNRLRYGSITFRKATTSGIGAELGWTADLFRVEADGSWTYITSGTTKQNKDDPTYTFEKLLPGQYVLQEDADSTREGYLVDATAHEVTVIAGQNSIVTVTNTHLGRGQIVKDMPDGGSAAGWEFDVYRISDSTFIGTYTTTSDSSVITDYLLPGEYLVYERLPEDSVYCCESPNPQTLTVYAGQTSSVTFTNRLKSAMIEVLKTDSNEKVLPDVSFLLEWSEDGVNWEPIVHTDSEYVKKGTCTSAGLVNGELTTNAAGIVSFTGLHPEMQYRLTEVSTPNGYQLLSDYVYIGGIPQGDFVLSLNAANASGFMLPMTGASTLQFVPVLSFLMALACIVVIATAVFPKKKV